MRRPVLYIAGLLLATGASLAIGGPASAAVSHNSQASAASYNPFGDDYYIDQSSNLDVDYSDNNDSYDQFSLINVLSPNGQDNTGLNLGLFGR